MTIKAVVFDIGGVLEYTPKTNWQAKWFTELKIDTAELGRKMAEFECDQGLGPCTEEEWEEQFRLAAGMTPEQMRGFMADYWKDYLGTLNVELETYIRGLRPRYQTALLSNSALGARQREQDAYQFDTYTDLIIYSHEEGIAKPDRRIYEITWQRLGIQPHEMIFVDDRESNVTAARDYGIHGVVFIDTAQTIADIEACIKTNTG